VLRAVGADEVLDPEEETARRLVQRLIIPDIQGYFELAEGFSVVEVEAPAGTVGKTLEELKLRRRYRINLVAIKHRSAGEPGAEPTIRFDPIPLPSTVIDETDVLALVGSDLDIANFMAELSD
jgi:trk system potassium uptake protein TrkA